MEVGTIDYGIDDALNVIKNIRNNPYGIKTTYHCIIRTRDRFVNLDLVYNKLCQEIPVGIEKEAMSSNRFLLIYCYTQYRDLAVAIEILNDNEINILSVIDKSINRRKH